MSFREVVLHVLGFYKQIQETLKPIIAERWNLPLDAILRIKKIKLLGDDDVHIIPYLRSRNGVIVSWTLISFVSNRSCIEAYTFAYFSFRSLTNQLLNIKAEWRIQIKIHVAVLEANQYLPIIIKRAAKKYNTQCEFSKYYINSFRHFENAIVLRTCNKYFIAYVRFLVTK